MTATRPAPSQRARLRTIRSRHAARPGLWERLSSADPSGARQAYLQEQLAMSERLSAVMAGALDADQLMRAVVDELHATFDLYLVSISRVDADHIMRLIAAAGPLAAAGRRFLITEQLLTEGVNGRVARTGETSLVPDTAADRDYIHFDPETDPRSELSVPIRVGNRTWGVLNLEEVRPAAFDERDATLMRTVATQLGVALHRIAIYGELEEALVTTLSVLAGAMEMRDPYTAEHEQAVAELAVRTADELALPASDRQAVRYAALTHDIGKISVPSAILSKPGALDPEEWAIMQRHTIVGAEMLARIPFFADVHPLVRSHHERVDGAGYPDRLSAGQIPIGARIVCVCDSYNAMITDRPYRRAMTAEAALAELQRCAGSQFDRDVVSALTRALAAER